MRFFFFTLYVVSFCFLGSASYAQEISTEVQAPKAISAPDADYGNNVKLYGGSGVVTVNAAIDKAGKVSVLGAFGPASLCSDLKSPIVEAIRNAAIDAATRSVYETPMKDGKPTDVNVHLTYKFAPPANASEKSTDNARPKMISGGVVNGKAKSQPRPSYPAAAGVTRVGGLVTIQVVISEAGEVLTAAAVSGHPLLREYAVEAACKAKFAPTTLQGNPVMVTGLLTYNFHP